MAKLLKVAGFDVLESESELTWHEATAWAEKANADSVGGFSDWVLPDTQTLRALAALKPVKSRFWSSSPYSGDSDGAWGVDFHDGYLDNDCYYLQVRLVRVGQCLEIGRDGQLESMRQAGIQLPAERGQIMQLIEIAGFPAVEFDPMTFCDAVKTPWQANAEAIGGFTDWVLPDTQTLRALAALKPEERWFWSSSPNASHSASAWGVNFDDAHVDGDDKDGYGQVRLVRAGQCLEIGRAGQLESMRQAGISCEEKSCSL